MLERTIGECEHLCNSRTQPRKARQGNSLPPLFNFGTQDSTVSEEKRNEGLLHQKGILRHVTVLLLTMDCLPDHSRPSIDLPLKGDVMFGTSVGFGYSLVL